MSISFQPPCRMIAPVFEDLAHEKAPKTAGGPGAAFTEIDMRTSHGSALASEWGIRVMPTFLFFLDGKKVAEMKGANANELRSQVDLLLFQAFPRTFKPVVCIFCGLIVSHLCSSSTHVSFPPGYASARSEAHSLYSSTCAGHSLGQIILLHRFSDVVFWGF